jgi:hypothetical protein
MIDVVDDEPMTGIGSSVSRVPEELCRIVRENSAALELMLPAQFSVGVRTDNFEVDALEETVKVPVSKKLHSTSSAIPDECD